jgi:hypothetical protein
MKTSSPAALRVVSLLCFLSLSILSASAHETVLPAGTLLKCTLDEPNFSSATVAVGDPVLCHLRSQVEFGRQTFPRGSYLVGHLEAAKDPGHFWGKGFIKIVFDRIGMPQGDMPLDAKVIATRGYKVDKYGDIDGKGHAKRDVVEWLIPPLWPWKIITLPMRGPRPTLKGESVLTLRLMDDVQLPQVSQTFGPDWHFFGTRPRTDAQYENDAYYGSVQGSVHGSISGSVGGSVTAAADGSVSYSAGPRLAVRRVTPNQPVAGTSQNVSYASYVTRPAVDDAAVTTSSLAAPSISDAEVHFVTSGSGVPVFVLKTGTVLAVDKYTYQDGRISYELASGGSGVISNDEVDWTTTAQKNLQRGVQVSLPSAHNPVVATAGY